MRKFLDRVRQDEVMACAVEYGLIAAAVATVIIAVASSFHGRLPNTFQSVSGVL